MHNVNWSITSIHLNNSAAAPNFKPMPTHTPYKAAIRPAQDAPKVMVAVVAGPDVPQVATAGALPRWRRLTPLALWSTLPLRDASRDGILRGVATLLARHNVHSHQLILLAERKAARAALELVLQGALDCAAILAIAAPCAALPFPIAPTSVTVRLVVNCEDEAGRPDQRAARRRYRRADHQAQSSRKPRRSNGGERSRNLRRGAGRKCQPPTPSSKPSWSVKRCCPERPFSSSARLS
jgi:hypothetical protein